MVKGVPADMLPQPYFFWVQLPLETWYSAISL